MKKLNVFARSFLTSAALAQQPTAAVEREFPGTKLVMTNNLEFAKANGKSLMLDFYRPQQASGPLPVLIWIHGEEGRFAGLPFTYPPFAALLFAALPAAHGLVEGVRAVSRSTAHPWRIVVCVSLLFGVAAYAARDHVHRWLERWEV